jgi:hypothetical protein
MSFGQASGPPATQRQVRELLELLQDAGHADFRDARGPMGFNQRQAGGRFTRDEADELIAQLTEAAEQRDLDPEAAAAPEPASRRVDPARRAARPGAVGTAERRAAVQARELRRVPAEVLAAELQRRGWAVIEP